MTDSTPATSTFCEVAVAAPVHSTFTYSTTDVPSALKVGDPVKVPFGKRELNAVVVNLIDSVPSPTDYDIRSVRELNPERAPIPPERLKWLMWLSDYYRHPLGMTLEMAFPPLKPGRSAFAIPADELKIEPGPQPSAAQEQVIEQIQSSKGFQVHLVHGVTGSGKTEVYLKLIERVLISGGTALFLVPEIALTPQLSQRVTARFPGQVSVIHSGLTPRGKTNAWYCCVNRQTAILLGARSALFCPLPNLGIIVVDEEHEDSYKQDEKLKYHGRDAAIVLAQHLNIPIVLGSATPSLESYANCLSDKYKYYEMPQPIYGQTPPTVEVIDLKTKPKAMDLDRPRWLSPELQSALEDNFRANRPAALFLNRRGTAQISLCGDCGYVMECANCSVALTLHSSHSLVCHYCNYTEALPRLCPSCHEPSINSHGIGTEQVENDLKKLWPDSRVFRADRDHIQHRDQYTELVTEMEASRIDFLVGTQMIAKGLDFPNLRLVGIILADIAFHIPDFRATERSFQLLTQMMGRTGRDPNGLGRVLVQTYNPDHPSLVMAKDRNFKELADQELEHRRALGYPPYGRLASFRISGHELKSVIALAQQLAQHCHGLKKTWTQFDGIRILGPAPAPILRMHNEYRYHLLLKAPRGPLLSHYLKTLAADHLRLKPKTKIKLDVDPYLLM